MSDQTVEALRELLREASRALKDAGKAAIVVKPTLDVPYKDDPRWTPWTRFVEQPSRRAYNLGFEIHRLVGPVPPTPEDDHPFGPAPTGWRAAPDCAWCKDVGRTTERGVDAHCTCKRGRRMSELWYAEKHGEYHPDMPEPSHFEDPGDES